MQFIVPDIVFMLFNLLFAKSQMATLSCQLHFHQKEAVGQGDNLILSINLNLWLRTILKMKIGFSGSCSSQPAQWVQTTPALTLLRDTQKYNNMWTCTEELVPRRGTVSSVIWNWFGSAASDLE